MDQSVGLPRGQVRLVAFDPGWANAFQEERGALLGSLSELVVDIEHIGSTAITGLPAKPIIDLLIGLVSFEHVDETVKRLAAHGYEDRGRPEVGRHHLAKGPHDRRTHYVHLVEQGSAQWHDKVRFRDYLQGHADRRREYAELKRALANRYAGDRSAYTSAKNAFVTETLELARRE
jgi:GrpB-like predicted nucleotidyltransferase (UPF0157 family)